MIIEIDSGAFLAAVKRAAQIIESRNVPILQTVLLEANGESLAVSATNMTQYMTLAVPCTPELGSYHRAAEESAPVLDAAAVDASLLIAAVKPGKALRIEFGNEYINLVSGRRNVSLKTLPAEDFPKFVQEAGESYDFTLTPEQLAGILLVRRGISTEETRYYLNGICLHQTANGLRAIATDGHRLFLSDVAASADIGPDRYIIPREAVAAIAAADWGGDLAGRINKRVVSFEGNGIKLASKLIDGSFPEYERIMVSAEGSRAEFTDFAEFSATIQKTAIFKEAIRGVKITPEDGGYAVESVYRGNLVQDFHECRPGSVKFGVNARYVDDIAAVITGDCTMYQRDGASPILFLPCIHQAGDDLPSVQVILMPMRV